MQARYVNPFTDFGFKKIFGEEASKPLLLDFLNALLPRQDRIQDLSFKNSEALGRSAEDRKSVFDIYCVGEGGERFIVELQKAKQNFFKERTVFYSTFPIREQGERGEWNFDLAAVYCIGILDFTFDDYEKEEDRNRVLHTIKLRNEEGKIFYDKLTYLYLEMPNFRKGESELSSRLDQWLYFIKNLEDFQAIPDIFRNEVVFETAFQKAEIARYGTAQWETYERSLREYRDMKGYIDTAKDQGRDEERIAIARRLKSLGIPVAQIATATGLTEAQIEKL